VGNAVPKATIKPLPSRLPTGQYPDVRDTVKPDGDDRHLEFASCRPPARIVGRARHDRFNHLVINKTTRSNSD